jgi:hypothetical protein
MKALIRARDTVLGTHRLVRLPGQGTTVLLPPPCPQGLVPGQESPHRIELVLATQSQSDTAQRSAAAHLPHGGAKG